MTDEIMEMKTKPAEMKSASGDAVTDTAGKPVSNVEVSQLPKGENTEPSMDDVILAELTKRGLLKDPKAALAAINKAIGVVAREEAKSDIEADKENLVKAHGELKDAIFPILEKHGIHLTKGKRILIHGGESDAKLFDIAFADPLPDKGKGKGGGTRERKASPMGCVVMRIPETGRKDTLDKPAAKSLSAFFQYFTGHGYEGYESASQAVKSIGDSRIDIPKTKRNDGVFNVQNVPEVAETTDKKGSPAYNIVSLTDKGYTFFGIAKGKAAVAATPAPETKPAPQKTAAEAPEKIETPADNTAAVAKPVETNLPANWNTMNKAERKAWRNKGKAS